MRVQLVKNVVTLASLIIAFLLLVGWVSNYFLAVNAINTANHRWCTTLSLLTSKPVPRPTDPAANPSRENSYLFYTHLKELEREFGCR